MAARRPAPEQLQLFHSAIHTASASMVLGALQDPEVQEAIAQIVQRALEADRAKQARGAGPQAPALVTDTGAAMALGCSLKTFRRWYEKHASLAALATNPTRRTERWPLAAVRAWWAANYR
jgi:hypothetical protein